MALDSDESQIIASTKSRALEMLLGGRAESAKGYVKMIYASLLPYRPLSSKE